MDGCNVQTVTKEIYTLIHAYHTRNKNSLLANQKGENMTNLQIAVKVISDYLQQELSDDYYKDDDIKNWLGGEIHLFCFSLFALHE